MITNNIYLYHLDAEVQKLYIRDNYQPQQMDGIIRHFSDVTRVAFLLCRNKLFVPFSNYCESSLAYSVLNDYAQISPSSLNPLVILSTAPDLKSALNNKEKEHQENFLSSHYKYGDFIESGLILPGAYQTRNRSASSDIECNLIASIKDEKIWMPFKKFIIPSLRFEQMQDQLADVPKRLNGQAYISEYILPLLSINPDRAKDADRAMNINVTRWYLESFLSELDAVCMRDIKYINELEILPDIQGREHLSFIGFVHKLSQVKIKRKTGKLLNRETEINAFSYISTCSMKELVEFKYGKEWDSICKPLINQNEQKQWSIGGKRMDGHDIRIGIVTALPEEAAAIISLMKKPKDDNKNDGRYVAGDRYTVGEIEAKDGGTHKVAVCQLLNMGNNLAAACTVVMEMHYRTMENIIVCGIAGGHPDHVRLGDVVVSTNGIIQYDFGKELIGADGSPEFIEKDPGSPCSGFLLEAVRLLETQEMLFGDQWKKYIPEVDLNTDEKHNFSLPAVKEEEYFEKHGTEYKKMKRDISKDPTLHTSCKIASGNIVQKRPERRDALLEKYGTYAIEMESAGIKDGTSLRGNGYIAIRGISDYCDGTKGDDWHNYASATAAAYTVALIKSLPSIKSSATASDDNNVVFVGANYGQVVYATNGASVEVVQNNRLDVSHIKELIDAVRLELQSSSGKDFDSARRYLEMIENELSKLTPRKNILDTVIAKLQALPETAEFGAAVVAAMAKLIDIMSVW